MVYDIKRMRAPRLSGRPLKLLAKIVDETRLGEFLQKPLLQVAGFQKLKRRRPTTLASSGPHLPIHPMWAAPESNIDLARVCEDAPHPTVAPFHSVLDYANAYRDETLTPSDVVERYLAALHSEDTRDPPLRAIIEQQPDDIRRQAEESTARHKEGRPLSILDGVLVPVKDEVDVKGLRSTMGTRIHGERPAPKDATTVARLRALGAIIVGKTNMHELGAGPTGHNVHYGTPPNPYNTAHYPGGSSSGSAAIVAAGLAPFSIGADGGGSIRLPASFCGLVGLKPTFGRVSRTGSVPIAWTVTHIGPLAASALDAVVAYAAMSGRDPNDPATLLQPPVNLDRVFDDDLTGMRVGVFRPWFQHAEPEVVAACDRMLGLLKEKGARIVEIEINDLDLARIVHLLTLGAEASATQRLVAEEHRRRSSAEVRIGLAVTRALSAPDYVLMQSHRKALSDAFFAKFTDVDVIVTPTAATPAPKMHAAPDAESPSDITMLSDTLRFTPIANLFGGPAISIPAGYTSKGLPIGFHAMGNAWDEATLLRLAVALERAVPRRRPMRFVDLLL